VGTPKPRILLADDEPALLAAIGEYLGCCGWEVHAVQTADEAKRLLQSESYAAVITDLRFSGPEGTEGLRVVAAARERQARIPVVVLTGHGSDDTETLARKLGADLFVPKPVALWELANLVRGWGIAETA